MPVYKEENGKYMFRVYLKNEEGKNVQYKRRGFETKKEAREAERLFAPSLNFKKKEENKRNTIYFESKVDDFFYAQRMILKITSYDTKHRQFNCHILPFFKGMEVKKITYKDVNDWQDEMLKKNNTITFTNRIYRVLKDYIAFLNNMYDIGNNPCTKVKAIRDTASDITSIKTRKKVCSREDFKKFIDSFTDDEIVEKVYFETMYKAGTRRSETRALTWKDVDFENHRLSINKQIVYTSEGQVLIATKSKTSNRFVYLCKSLEESLKELYEKKKCSNMQDLFIFGNIKPLGQSYFDRAKKKHIDISKVPEFTNHELRHSYGSNLLNDGFDIKFVSTQMGHESINITLTTYHHLLSETENINRVKYYDNY